MFLLLIKLHYKSRLTNIGALIVWIYPNTLAPIKHKVKKMSNRKDVDQLYEDFVTQLEDHFAYKSDSLDRDDFERLLDNLRDELSNLEEWHE